ncbi:hypothetical protein QVD17_08394 [Tagetes erecta]|uniref:Membrane-associated kinase regulator 2 n=1 Tax=Tagetes erecta TaxID=13708 RepID=A0AAD8L2W8_TARER|nr:hypothetical protein QVD17_08394 [Tagetes erecta]
MDVFSLLKFWRNTGGRDPPPAGDFDSTIDDEDSFFDLVFTTNSADDDESRSSFRFCSPDEVYLNNNNKRSIFSFDSPNAKTSPQSPLRLLMLGFQNTRNSEENERNREIEENKKGALLKRDNSLRHKLMTEKLLESDQTPSKRFSKDVVNKYLNLIKPAKKSTDKSRLSEKSVTPSSSPAFSPRKEEKRGGGGGGGAVFREVRKRLGKSRSASAILQTPARKSDDSVVEQQDGIQGAILHCKRSYNNLSRSGSAPSKNQQRISVEEQIRSSI